MGVIKQVTDSGTIALVMAMPVEASAASGFTLQGERVFQETYRGMVVEVKKGYRRTWDSYADCSYQQHYAYALVWDTAKGEPLNVEFAIYDNSYDHHCNGSAEVDASEEVLALYEAFVAKRDAAEREAERLAGEKRLARGKVVVVVRGRKVPKGTEGEIFWMGNNGYGESVGLVLADGSKAFTAAKNVDVKLNEDGWALRAPKSERAPEAAPAGLKRGALVKVRGEVGEVFWAGEAKNGSGWRVGVKFDSGVKDFVAANRVEIVRAA